MVLKYKYKSTLKVLKYFLSTLCMGHCSVGRVGHMAHGPPKIFIGWATVHLAPPIIGQFVSKISLKGKYSAITASCSMCWHTSCCAKLCLSERLAHEALWMFFSQVGHRHSILKEELVNGHKNFNRTMCKIVIHSLLNFPHITQDFYLSPIPMLWVIGHRLLVERRS